MRNLKKGNDYTEITKVILEKESSIYMIRTIFRIT